MEYISICLGYNPERKEGSKGGRIDVMDIEIVVDR